MSLQLDDIVDWISSKIFKPLTGKRTVYINDPVANQQFKRQFTNNSVSTAKYTLITFIPKNLVEQFLRVANLYFLLISCLQVFTDLSPTGKTGTVIPLVLVILFQAAKDAFEDIKRHIADRAVNNSIALVLRGTELKRVLWRDVKVGDIVKVEGNHSFPADLICLSSSEKQGLLYIETSQLDGETNLKIRHSLADTMEVTSEEQLAQLQGDLVIDHPNEILDRIEGNINFKLSNGSVKSVSLSPENMLLRGAMLKNTKFIWGVVMYTGKQTKLMKNLRRPPHKRSKVERITNYIILLLFAVLFLITITCSIAVAAFNTLNIDDHWYVDPPTLVHPSVIGWQGLITYFILFNNFIPISLYVTMELVKAFQARLFIDNDLEMYHDETDTPALSKTSSLNEELGCVEYVFSDKTGTLTQNKMEFLKFCVDGIEFGKGTTEIGRAAAKRNGEELKDDRPVGWQPIAPDFQFFDDRILHGAWKSQACKDSLFEFFALLAVCHTVVPEEDKKDPNSVIYQAASPDEGALVKAAKYLGFYFHSRTHDSVTIRIDSKDYTYKFMNVLEFNSTRKRMSVIVKQPESLGGKIVLYCKGADSIIKPLMKKPISKFMEPTEEVLKKFGNEGLRTLLCCKLVLDEAKYNDWLKNHWEKANLALSNKAQLVDDAAAMIEKDMELVGATAIEDKLQDGVPETISSLAEAGVKIWVLTGDKQETAINIGFACAMLDNNMHTIKLNEDKRRQLRKKLEIELAEAAKKKREGKDLAVVVDGSTLLLIIKTKAAKKAKKTPEEEQKEAEKKEENKEPQIDNTPDFPGEEPLHLMFLRLALQCKSVICCRVSPLQKSQIVMLVKENLPGSITLAIGDGANDVSMIQAAHIGVGISGQEGLQAARAADYSFAQFRFLKRLLLVHGRYNYRRVAKLIVYSFYKNATYQFTQFWYIFFNAFSGKSLYDNNLYSLYNVFWAQWPIFFFAILDKDISPQKSMEFPRLYTLGQHDYYFNIRIFLLWFINAIFTSLVVFFVPYIAYMNGVYIGGKSLDSESFGLLLLSIIIFVVNSKVMLELHYWDPITLLSFLATMLIWPVFLLIYNAILGIFPNLSGELNGPAGTYYGLRNTLRVVYFNIYDSVANPSWWLVLILTCMVCLLKDIAWKAFYRLVNKQLYHVIQDLGDKATVETVRKIYPHHDKMKGKDRTIDTRGIWGKIFCCLGPKKYKTYAETPLIASGDQKFYNTGYDFSQTDGGQADMLEEATGGKQRPHTTIVTEFDSHAPAVTTHVVYQDQEPTSPVTSQNIDIIAP